jgi:hypothetical protein
MYSISTDWEGTDLEVEFAMESEGDYISAWFVYAVKDGVRIEITLIVDGNKKLFDHLTSLCLNEALNGETA